MVKFVALKYNIKKIKIFHAYTPKEIADNFCIDKKTVFRWLEKGLPVMKRGTKPLLIMGSDLKAFLIDKRVRFKLSENEYFCLKCKRPVTSLRQGETVMTTGHLIGKKAKKQEKKVGFCDSCGSKVQKFLGETKKD